VVRGQYLFQNVESLAEFDRDPAVDPAYRRIAELSNNSPIQPEALDNVEPLTVLDRPLFIIAAPRSGSTLLYELLAQNSHVWTIDGESEGVIEGIHPLHPANRGYDSHRLTDGDANSDTTQDLVSGFLVGLRDRGGKRLFDLPEERRPRYVRMLEKTTENALRISFLAATFPTARFVFLHRDARQSVSSILQAWHHDGFVNIPDLPGWRLQRWHFLLPVGWRAFSDASLLDIAAFQWSAANRSAMDDFEALSKDRWMSMDYAELVAAPQSAVRRTCDFAEIPVDDHLQSALAGPLPLSSTTISPPSPIKWRSNPGFREATLDRHRLVMARLRDLGKQSAPPPPPRMPATTVRFSCFLDEMRRPPRATSEERMVSPYLHFQLGATVPLALLRRTRFRERFLSDFSLLWVEDAATRVIYPFWLRHRQVALFRQFVAGHPPPVRLDDDLMDRLVNASILVSRAELECQSRAWCALVEDARIRFEEQRYCTLPSLLREAHVAALGRYYRSLIEYGGWQFGDEQVQLRYGHHNETVARYFHHQLTDLVSRVAGEPLKPTYAYVSAYREGAVLHPHVDRRQCVFTLSLWIDHDTAKTAEPWPLWFQTHHGQVALVQKAGDAVLFRGCELPHWRDRPPPGSASMTLLFHYVPQDFNETLD
jgi:hypothetical protein